MKTFGRYYYIISQTIIQMITPPLLTWFICYKAGASKTLTYILILFFTLVGVVSGIMLCLYMCNFFEKKKKIKEEMKKIEENKTTKTK